MKTPQVEVSEFSTTTSGRKEVDAYAVVRFDSECSLCRSLAGFMGQRVSSDLISFQPSTELSVQSLEVEVFKENQKIVFSGADAWTWLMREHPSLSELNWIAQKLGIQKTASLTLQRSAELLRKFCFRCR